MRGVSGRGTAKEVILFSLYQVVQPYVEKGRSFKEPALPYMCRTAACQPVRQYQERLTSCDE